MTDLNMLNLEIPAERVLKPLWVQLLLVFLLFVCGVVLFCFFFRRKAPAYTAEGTTYWLLWVA